MYLRIYLLLLLTLHARAALERLPQIDDAHIYKVICSRSEPAHLMVLAQKTLYLSRNDGDSFQRYMRTQNGPFTDAIVENSTSLYVSDTRHIFHTSAPLDPLFTTHDHHHINTTTAIIITSIVIMFTVIFIFISNVSLTHNRDCVDSTLRARD